MIALWGSKSLDGVQDLDVSFSIPRVQIRKRGREKEVNSRISEVEVCIRGLISTPGCGRSSTDRQFLYINGRPCGLVKVSTRLCQRSPLIFSFRYRRRSMKFIAHLPPITTPLPRLPLLWLILRYPPVHLAFYSFDIMSLTFSLRYL